MFNQNQVHSLPLASLVLLLSFAPLPAAAAETESNHPPAAFPPETPNNPYIAAPRDHQPRSPGLRFTTSTFSAVQVNVDSLGQNIVGDAANEPSLAIDPTDPDRMVIGWRQFDTIASDFRQAGYAYTTNGGLNWTFPGVIQPGIFRSDPVLSSDTQGKIYFNSLTTDGVNYTCNVFRAPDGGADWDAGVSAHGGDKQWMTIDKSGGVGNGNIYANWTDVYSSCYPGSFTRSVDGGDFYQDCITITGTPYWGTETVGPGGRLYLVGASNNDFVVARSTNAHVPGDPVIWDRSTVFSLGGYIDYGTGPNPGGLLGQAWIATAPTSPGPARDTLYVLCSVHPSGSDPLNVMFSRSMDGGATWSTPVRVNDDTGTNAYQWFGTMSVSPSGRIDAVWLDTRNNPGTYLSSLYYSYSTNGGRTWSANERLSGAFDPYVGWPQQQKMGDYFHMISDDAGFRLAWAATFNGEEDVYFGRYLNVATGVAHEPVPAAVALLSTEPNPFAKTATIHYTVPRDAFVTLGVYDALGRKVATLVSGRKPAGSYEAELDGRGLPSGVYFCHLTAGDSQDTKRVQLLK